MSFVFEVVEKYLDDESVANTERHSFNRNHCMLCKEDDFYVKELKLFGKAESLSFLYLCNPCPMVQFVGNIQHFKEFFNVEISDEFARKKGEIETHNTTSIEYCCPTCYPNPKSNWSIVNHHVVISDFVLDRELYELEQLEIRDYTVLFSCLTCQNHYFEYTTDKNSDEAYLLLDHVLKMKISK